MVMVTVRAQSVGLSSAKKKVSLRVIDQLCRGHLDGELEESGLKLKATIGGERDGASDEEKT